MTNAKVAQGMATLSALEPRSFAGLRSCPALADTISTAPDDLAPLVWPLSQPGCDKHGCSPDFLIS